MAHAVNYHSAHDIFVPRANLHTYFHGHQFMLDHLIVFVDSVAAMRLDQTLHYRALGKPLLQVSFTPHRYRPSTCL